MNCSCLFSCVAHRGVGVSKFWRVLFHKFLKPTSGHFSWLHMSAIESPFNPRVAMAAWGEPLVPLGRRVTSLENDFIFRETVLAAEIRALQGEVRQLRSLVNGPDGAFLADGWCWSGIYFFRQGLQWRSASVIADPGILGEDVCTKIAVAPSSQRTSFF